MNRKLKLEDMEKAINYYSQFMSFIKEDDELLSYEECDELEIEYPYDIKQMKKYFMGYNAEIIDCYDDFETDESKRVSYILDNKCHEVTIESENFTIKEWFTVVSMIHNHLKRVKLELFVGFGNEKDEGDNVKIYHGESTAFDMWLTDFHEFWTSRLNSDNKFKKVHIFTGDYDNEEYELHQKDVIVCVTLE